MHCSRSMIGTFYRAESAGEDGVGAWLNRQVLPDVRFALYGRTSTAESQDPVTSRAWQREITAARLPGPALLSVWRS